eukprot:TCONS_00034107-protein
MFCISEFRCKWFVLIYIRTLGTASLSCVFKASVLPHGPFSVLHLLSADCCIFAVLYPVLCCTSNQIMLSQRLFFTILMFLTTPPLTPTPAAEDDTINATRKKKCPGCQRNHDIHTFGPPGRNCQGPVSSSSSTHSPNRTRSSRVASPIDSGKTPNAGAMSDEQLNQYRQHLQLLKNQESELLESIRLEQENYLREKKHP